eukprot:TRINITY_DN1792_c0_g1_i1.p3 TRINITY_DN1792_c0_g1~~TRINITY_DN1792_c0_g1_i1.p3  ORF type:complete len:120 (-),score=44.96 TRINITY_DN1792_c0_g1_i1:115-474(-)
MDDMLVVKATSKRDGTQIAVGDLDYEDGWPSDFFAEDDERRVLMRLLNEDPLGNGFYDDDHGGEIFEEGELDETALATDDLYDSLELEEELEEDDRRKQDEEDENEARRMVEKLQKEKM